MEPEVEYLTLYYIYIYTLHSLLYSFLNLSIFRILPFREKKKTEQILFFFLLNRKKKKGAD